MTRRKVGQAGNIFIRVGCCLCAALLFIGCRKQEAVFVAGESVAEQQDAVARQDAVEPMEETTSQTLLDPRSSLKVYVCGAVAVPGVYDLKEGARVADAIHLAGGMTEDAALDALNLAEYIADAQMIRVPSMEEVHENPERYPAYAKTVGESADGTESSGKISLSRATKEQLMTLPGIGEAKADAILAYRAEAGGFDQIEDLMNVPGIKEGAFLKMKDKITE